MLENWSAGDKAKLTTWLVDQRRFGEGCPKISSDVLRTAQNAAPLRFSEKKRRLFLWISARGMKAHDDIAYAGVVKPHVTETLDQLAAWMECEDNKEVGAMMSLFVSDGLFENRSSGRVRLTSQGFDYLETIEAGGAVTDQAFVAMWFTQELDSVYKKAIAPAIIDAGYRPLRIDQKETINKIDDEIIAEIRSSRFIVADFTCGIFDHSEKKRGEARGGVYFEAGFAMGLRMPVVWTVRSDCVDFLHFDTQQFAHIVWSDPEDLRERLTNRIRAVIGQGPTKPDRLG
ncbi:MAG: hypothetical protein APF82_01870 [Sphingomonadales bacterium BRH_c42]|nr:MAG: hypothetical protein APF82_01870 [Sphingomonadales bacterium BRH_c42]